MKAEIKGVGLHGEDLQEFDVYNHQHQHQHQAKTEEEIWFQTGGSSHEQNDNRQHQNDDGLLDVDVDVDVDMDVSDPSSLFYADEFPALPDFPCMSSSSSSSSAPAAPPPAAKPFASTATSSSASTASSGAASWAAEHETMPSENQGSGGGRETTIGSMSVDDVDQCMDLMENFGCIDLLESSDICWDPSPLFDDQAHHLVQHQLDRDREEEDEERAFEEFMLQGESAVVDVDVVVGSTEENNNINNSNNYNHHQQQQQQQHEHQSSFSSSSSDDLAMVFFEWLKCNKEAISAEDLRNIKIKKSTIEAAAKRLGGGKEGMKQLLKLILQWVQNHHLQSKRVIVRDSSVVSNTTLVVVDDHQPNNNNNTAKNNNNNVVTNNSIPESINISPNPNPPPPLDQQQQQQQPNTSTSCFSPPPQATWMSAPPPPPPPPPFEPTIVPAPPAGFSPMVGYMGPDPYSTGVAYPTTDYHQMLDTTAPHSWPHAPTMQFGLGPQYGPFHDPGHAAQFGGYGSPYPGLYYHPGPGDGLVRLGSSATKEARKKRMARQRRFFTHHHRNHHHHHHHNQNNQQNNPTVEQHAGVGNGTSGVAPHHNPGNWVYWAHPPPPPPPPPQVSHPVGVGPPVVAQMQGLERPALPGTGFQRPIGVEKKQGWKTEKNLRFLLQKVLKQSDVGNLGRIVLPKKEAEMHLPELEARDGIPIAMEDIGTSRIWNMRYRFWPNNKSRMYLLENTGDFVRSNGLQEGDFIVIYSDVKCGKYMIRGVKVRPQQQGAKPETTNKKPSKTQKTQGSSSPAGNGPSFSPSSMAK